MAAQCFSRETDSVLITIDKMDSFEDTLCGHFIEEVQYEYHWLDF